MKTRSRHLANLKFPQKGSGQRTSYGLSPNNFPDSVKPFIDQDYVHKLSREDQLWLASFNNNYYGADFRESKDGLEAPLQWTKEQKSEIYNRKNAANEDYYHIVQVRGDTLYIDIPPRLSPAVISGILGQRQASMEGSTVEFEIPAPDQDFSAPPAYLNTPEYRKAVTDFRSTLRTGRGNFLPNTWDPKYKKTREALNAVVKRGLPVETDNLPSLEEVEQSFPKPKRKEINALRDSEKE